VTSAWSSVASFTLDTTAPDAPTLRLPAVDGRVALSKPTFSWTAAPTANRYRIQVATNNAFSGALLLDTETASTAVVSTVVLPQGIYYWQVQSRDAVGNWGDFSAPRAFSVNLTLTPAQTSVSAVAYPRFTWTAYPAALAYRLEVATDAAFQHPVDSYPVTRSTVSYTAPSALPNGIYFWRVSVDLGAGFVPSPVSSSFTISPTALAPRLSQPTNAAVLVTASPTLIWLATTSAGSYTYQIQIDDDLAFRSPALDQAVNDLFLTTTLPDGRYYWRVRAVNSLGVTSAWSSVASFTLDTT
jgi:hypothetical protein